MKSTSIRSASISSQVVRKTKAKKTSISVMKNLTKSPMKKPVALHFMVEEKKETRNLAKKDTILPVIPNNSIEFTTQVEANKETAVQVYFLGTNGKTYPTAKPSIEIQDAKTGKTITSFKRDVKNGEPVPQQVPPGTYNLVVADFHTYFVGKAGILAQDLLIPRGTVAIVPGLPKR